MFFFLIGGQHYKWYEKYSKSAVYHKKTFKQINKYKKKHLENVKPPKKSAFLWKHFMFCVF